MRVATAVPLDRERELQGTAGFHGHELVATCSGGDELALRLTGVDVDRVLVAATPEHLTRRLIEASDRLGIRMTVVVDDEAARTHARRLGILETSDGPVRWELLAEPGAVGEGTPVGLVLPDDADAAVDPIPLATARRPAMVVAVWGPHGAPGRTSLSIALAAEIAASGRRVVLVDADTHAAAIAPSLGLLDEAPGFAAACRLARIGGLDEAQLDRIAVAHPSSRHPFRILTGIGRSARWPELGADRVEQVLTILRRVCDVVVVDVGASLEAASDVEPEAPHRDAATVAVVRAADRVVALAAADPVGVSRFLRAHSELLGLVDPTRVVHVANKVRAGAIGVNPAGQLRQTLARFGGVDELAVVPWDPAAFDAALLSGRSLAEVAPRSPARLAVRELAQRIAPVPGEAAVGRSRRRLA